MKEQQFALSESESHFLTHTCMLTKPRKNYDGKKKPVSKIEPPLPDSNTCKPQVMKKPFKFHCINCGEEYVNAEKHETDCKHTISLLIECPVCFQTYYNMNQHIHYKKPIAQKETIWTLKCPFCLVGIDDYINHFCQQMEWYNMGLNGITKLPVKTHSNRKYTKFLKDTKEELEKRKKRCIK